MDVTLLGMVIEVNPLHPLNASEPIDVTLLGIIIEVTSTDFLKALLPIAVTSHTTPSYSMVFGILTAPP